MIGEVFVADEYVFLWQKVISYQKRKPLTLQIRVRGQLEDSSFFPCSFIIYASRNADFVHHDLLNYLYFQFCFIFKSRRNNKNNLNIMHIYILSDRTYLCYEVILIWFFF